MRKFFTALVSAICLTMSAVGWSAESQFNPAKARRTPSRSLTRVDAKSEIRKAAADEVSIVPAQGNVQSLKSFSVTFSSAEAVTRGNVGYGNAPTVHKTGDPDGDKQYCFNMSFEGNTMTLTVNNEITDEGNWTLTLPAGFYLIDGVESTEPLEFNYTIAPVIVEDGKIIYEAPKGTKVECMTRVLGWAVINNQLLGTEFAGKPMHYVLTDDDCIYVYNPIVLSPFTGQQMDTYIKGVKDGDDYLFTFPQPIYEQEAEGETKTWYANKLRMEIYDEQHSDYVLDETNTVRMKVNEDGSLECSQAWDQSTDLLGILVDGKWNGFGGNRLLYRVMNFVAAEPPADLETEDAEAEYADTDGNPDSAFLKYGIAGNDIWIKGFGLEILPDAWIHGTIDGENIIFDQYMGLSDRYGQYVFLCGCEYSEGLKLYPTEFAFDKEKMTITCNTNLCLNANNEFYYAFEEFQYCTVKLGSEDSDLTSRVPATPVSISKFEQIDAERGQYDMTFEICDLNADGQILPEKRLSFQIILPDEEVYVFQPYRYSGISQSLSEIAYNSDYAFIERAGNERSLTLYDIKDNSDIGVRMQYKDASGSYYSDIRWFKKNSIQTTDASAEIIETEWFDMTGRRIVNPSGGIFIRCDHYLNGTKGVSKVNVKQQ